MSRPADYRKWFRFDWRVRLDIAIERIINPITDVTVQTRCPIDKRLQPTAGGSDTFQRVNADRLQDSTAVGAESLAHVAFARDATKTR